MRFIYLMVNGTPCPQLLVNEGVSLSVLKEATYARPPVELPDNNKNTLDELIELFPVMA